MNSVIGGDGDSERTRPDTRPKVTYSWLTTDRRTDGQMDVRTHGKTEGRTDDQMGGRTDGGKHNTCFTYRVASFELNTKDKTPICDGSICHRPPYGTASPKTEHRGRLYTSQFLKIYPEESYFPLLNKYKQK